MAERLYKSARDDSEQPLHSRARCNIPGIPLIASAEQDRIDITARQPAEFWTDSVISAGHRSLPNDRCCLQAPLATLQHLSNNPDSLNKNGKRGIAELGRYWRLK